MNSKEACGCSQEGGATGCAGCSAGEAAYWCESCRRAVTDKRCPLCGLKTRRRRPDDAL